MGKPKYKCDNCTFISRDLKKVENHDKDCLAKRLAATIAATSDPVDRLTAMKEHREANEAHKPQIQCKHCDKEGSKNQIARHTKECEIKKLLDANPDTGSTS